MTTAAAQEKYLEQVKDLYKDISKDPNPGEPGVESPFQALIINIWKIFQDFPDDEESYACEFLEGFLANPVSPFGYVTGNREFDDVLRKYEPKFIETAKGHYKAAIQNWTKVLSCDTPASAEEYAESFLKAEKINLGVWGELTFFPKKD